MHKFVTIQNEAGETRNCRVWTSVTDPRLNAHVHAAVMAALASYAGPDGERVVHHRDARNRPDGDVD